MIRVVQDDIERFGIDVAAHLEALLGVDLVGAYFVGSIAVGGYVPGASDVDMVGVSSAPVAEDMKRSIADDLLNLRDTCPARGMESTPYRRGVVAVPLQAADFEVTSTEDRNGDLDPPRLS